MLARLHGQGRFERITHTIEAVTQRPAKTVEAFVADHAAMFA